MLSKNKNSLLLLNKYNKNIEDNILEEVIEEIRTEVIINRENHLRVTIN